MKPIFLNTPYIESTGEIKIPPGERKQVKMKLQIEGVARVLSINEHVELILQELSNVSNGNEKVYLEQNLEKKILLIRQEITNLPSEENDKSKKLLTKLEKIEKFINKDRRKNNFEGLIKSIKNPKSFLKYVRRTLGTTGFDFELLLGLLDKIKTENLKVKGGGLSRGSSYSINFHLETLLDPRFFHFLKDVKKKSGIHDLNFIKIEILEEKSKKTMTPEKFKQLASLINKLKDEGIQIGLDDYPEGNNNKDFLQKLKEAGAKPNFIKLDGAKVIRFFTGKKIEGDPENKEELTKYIKGLVDQINPEKKNGGNGTYITLEGITNAEALVWIRDTSNGLYKYIDYIQGYAVGMKEEIK